MISVFPRKRNRYVLIDVNTQYDLVYRNGFDDRETVRHIRRLIAWSRVHHIPLISIALSRRPTRCPDAFPEDETLCQEGTAGQRKIPYTMIYPNITFTAENRLDLPQNLFKQYHQIIFEVRSNDPFSLPRADRLLTSLRMDTFVVFGFTLEEAICHTALGLLQRGKKVILVEDAIATGVNGKSGLAIRKLQAKGARLIQTEKLTGPSRLVGPLQKRSPKQNDSLINTRPG